MPRLDKSQFKRLKTALEDAFSTNESLEELANEAQGKTLDQIATGSSVGAKINKIIMRAQDEGWLTDLIEAACDLRESDAELHAIRQAFQPLMIQELADPYETLVLQGDRVLVDRRVLRNELKGLRADHRRILIVTGPSGSGRTYTKHLISYLSTREGFRVVPVDLERRAQGSRDREVLPETLGQSIADQMGLTGIPERKRGLLVQLGLSRVPRRHNEQDARWNKEFCDWLTGELENKTTTYWIILDSFDKVLLPWGTQELIRELALRIVTSLDKMRLVLLSYSEPDTLPEDVQGVFAHEPLNILGESELIEFFMRLYGQRDQSLTDLGSEIADSVSKVLKRVNPGDAQYMRALGRAVADEAKAVIGG